MKYVVVGVEDRPSEAVLTRLVDEHRHALTITSVIGNSGWGLLKKRMPSFAQTSQHSPVIVLTDLDARECAPSMVREWMNGVTFATPNMLVRVAKREIEAWIIADHDALRELLHLPNLAIPPQVDDIDDPKRWLLQAAQRSPRRVGTLLTRKEGSEVLPSLDYNATLIEHVKTAWDPERAAANSESLARARRAIADMAREGDTDTNPEATDG